MPELIRFALLDGIPHGVSTRHGGVSPEPYNTLNLGYATDDDEDNVAQNRRAFAAAVGAHYEQVVSGRLSHGKDVHVFRETDGEAPMAPVRRESQRTEPAFWADAAISACVGTYFMMTFGDCVPILLADRRLGVVGAAHAGWRGTALGIAGEVVCAMRREFGSDPEDIVACIGPSIGPCCYTVGEEVVSTFASNAVEPVLKCTADSVFLDLWATNEQELRDSGVSADSIENPRLCTGCNTDRFFSHRAEGGRTGRFGLCIGLS